MDLRRALALVAAAVIVMLLGACSGDEPEQNDTSQFIVPPDPTATVSSEAQASDADAPETDSNPEEAVQLEGTVLNPFDLDQGDCFNEYRFTDRAGNRQQLTSRVDCARPHDREVYFKVDHPGDADARYPGESELLQWATDTCLEEFETFVGKEYILSALEFATLQPSFETWNGAGRHRGVTCFLFPFEGGRLQGTMSDSQI